MTDELKGPTAKHRLLDLGKLNEGKANEYGPFERLGEILATMFPNGVALGTAADFNRFALLVQIVNKLNRNAQYMPTQVHPDSLDDIAVLSMMLQSFHADGHT